MEWGLSSYTDEPVDETGLMEEQVFVSKVMRGLRLVAVESEKVAAEVDPTRADENKDEEFGKPGFKRDEYQEATYHTLAGMEKGSKKVEIKTYAPQIFLDIRRLCKVRTKDFVEGWTFPKEDIPQPALGAGRSGSLFITSSNKKYIFKTIPHFEVDTLVEILPYLHKHYNDNPDSRIARFLGLYRFHKHGGVMSDEMHVIIMTNMLHHPGWPIHQKYDLKGRKPKPGKASRNVEEKEKEGKVLKDNDDLTRKFYLDEPVRDQLMATLQKDVDFLLAHNCMDYSLLIGVHQKNRIGEHKPEPEEQETKKKKKKDGSKKTKKRSATVSSAKKGEDSIDGKAASDGEEKGKKKKGKKGKKDKKGEKDLETKKAKKAKKAAEYHEDTLPPVLSDEEHQEVYFIGIIDPLSRYNTKKKVAHLLKITLWDPDTLSTIPAEPYAVRYKNYLKEIFLTKEEAEKLAKEQENKEKGEEEESDGKADKQGDNKSAKGKAENESSKEKPKNGSKKEKDTKGEKKGKAPVEEEKKEEGSKRKKKKAAEEDAEEKENGKEDGKTKKKEGSKKKKAEGAEGSKKANGEGNEKGSKKKKAAKDDEAAKENGGDKKKVKGSKKKKAEASSD